MKELKVELSLNGSQLPKRAHTEDAGADVYSPQEILIPAGQVVPINLGVAVELEVGFMALIHPRSGHVKRGIIAQMPPIDAGYRGEIHAMILNTTDKDVIIEEGERVGQIVVIPIVTPKLIRVEFIDKDTTRGSKRFNSTGK